MTAFTTNLLIALLFVIELSYKVPDKQDPFHHPELRLLPLTDVPPSEVKIETEFRGAKQRFGSFAFGDVNGPSVGVAMDFQEEGKVELHVDRNWNQILEASERLESGVEWEVALEADCQANTASFKRLRTVSFRYGRLTESLSCAACGYIEGTVSIDGKTVPIRRIDGNCNGLFADPQDHVWINFQKTMEWDPVCHQFPVKPTMSMGGQRYLMKADALGERLTLEPTDAVGKLKLAAMDLADGIELVDFAAIVVSRDGAATSFSMAEEVRELPPGEYACSDLRFSLRQKGKIWTYVFFSPNEEHRQWEALKENETLAIDILGVTRFDLAVSTKEVFAKSISRMQPQLWTESGLLIKTIYHGLEAPLYNGIDIAQIQVRQDGQTLAQGTSGFACGTFCSVAIEVPKKTKPGTIDVCVDFNSGPLAGFLSASDKVVVKQN